MKNGSAAPDLRNLIPWIGLLSEVALPVLFLMAWLAPHLQSKDRTISFLIIFAGENLVLLAMLILSPPSNWDFRDRFIVTAYGFLILVVASIGFGTRQYETGIAALLLFVRFVSVAMGRKTHADEFPARPLEAFIALTMLWALIFALDYLNQRGMHISSDRVVGDMAAHGTVYFSIILGIRAVRLFRLGLAGRR